MAPWWTKVLRRSSSCPALEKAPLATLTMEPPRPSSTVTHHRPTLVEIHQGIIDKTTLEPLSIEPTIVVSGNQRERIQVTIWWGPKTDDDQNRVAVASQLPRPEYAYTTLCCWYHYETHEATINNFKAEVSAGMEFAMRFCTGAFHLNPDRSWSLTQPPVPGSMDFGLAAPWSSVAEILRSTAEAIGARDVHLGRWEQRARRPLHVSWTS